MHLRAINWHFLHNRLKSLSLSSSGTINPLVCRCLRQISLGDLSSGGWRLVLGGKWPSLLLAPLVPLLLWGERTFKSCFVFSVCSCQKHLEERAFQGVPCGLMSNRCTSEHILGYCMLGGEFKPWHKSAVRWNPLVLLFKGQKCGLMNVAQRAVWHWLPV